MSTDIEFYMKSIDIEILIRYCSMSQNYVDFLFDSNGCKLIRVPALRGGGLCDPQCLSVVMRKRDNSKYSKLINFVMEINPHLLGTVIRVVQVQAAPLKYWSIDKIE